MLINPYTVRLATIPGTRILEESFNLGGFQIPDVNNPNRVWTLQYLLEPIPNRYLGGIRARFTDDKDFVSFCNQRDLEVWLGVANPGDDCPWTNGEYLDLDSPGWYGLCTDEEDLLDDLYDRELRLRVEHPILPPEFELTRRVHDGGNDYEELFTVINDVDEDGYSPDTRMSTLAKRWVRIQRTALRWRYI